MGYRRYLDKNRHVRLFLSKDRSSQTIEKFINENFLEGTNFTYDAWPSYNMLNNNLNYTHEIHRHGGGYLDREAIRLPILKTIWHNLKY